MSLDQGLLESAYENLLQSISEYNDKYGYLGANWEREIQELFDNNENISFRVYYEDMIYSCDIYFNAGEWFPDTYLWHCAEEALEFGIEDERIDNPVPFYIEQA